MITCKFGLPGCGKTTDLVHDAIKEMRRIHRGTSKYKHVYVNTEVNYPGVELIHWDDVGTKMLRDAFILIDEATLFADCRRYKTFPKEKIEWFMTHRHYCCDLVYYTQFFDAVDKRMRMVTDRVYYMRKIPLLGLTSITRIPKTIIIPEETGEIIEGFRKPSILEWSWCKRFIFRPFWYKYFDSWVEYASLPPITPKVCPGTPRMVDQVYSRLRTLCSSGIPRPPKA